MFKFLLNMFKKKPHQGYDEWYLSQAKDHADVEYRQKQLDRRRK